MRPEELFFNIEEAAQFASTHEATGVHTMYTYVNGHGWFPVFFVTVRVHDEQDELWLAVLEMFRQALTH